MENEGNVLVQKYDLGRLLGQGNFAKVYYGRNLETGEGVAIKVLDKEKILKVGLIEQTKREISVMGLVKHENVVKLHEVMATKTKIYLVMEYAKGGELFNKVAKGRLREDRVRKYFQQLISAVGCCHGRGVYHRDLKPENLLLDENGNLKMSDFGLSALADSKQQDGLLHTTCGTPAYVAPEVISRRGYDGAKADVWSCGVILFVMLAGFPPFYDANLMEVYRKISNAEYKCPNWFPPEVCRLLSRILDPNPHTRISIEKIMKSPWFRRGLGTRPAREIDIAEKPLLDAEPVLGQEKPKSSKLTSLNAFNIISLSSGFDLSGLFVTDEQKEDVQFTSTKPAAEIISKFEDISRDYKLRVVKKEGGMMKLEGSNGRRTGTVSICAEIFEIAPSFHLVEVTKCSGDSGEYQKMLRQNIKPALGEIVWAWQGEQLHL